ncbi:MAG: YggS family pyridoxal phosphate-dependent enzyme [Nitrospiraceae bacterium]|nr:YggS family pyridoxal phosphate-dependent enzyme [Nitrospiraceae bacterium]
MEPPPLNDSGADTLATRVQLVRSRISRAAIKVGRKPQDIRLVAATKTVTVDRMRAAIEAGLSIVGENRLQEASPKMAALKDAPVRWHFIGHLQRRKARSVIGVFDLVHSVDSLELAQEINKRAGQAAVCQEVLLEVNLGQEPTKSGFHPEDLIALVPALGSLPCLRVKGLMIIPPPTAKAEQARPYFSRLRHMAERIAALRLPTITMDELSMGMSHDFEIAIEEGATLVRVGAAIFGARHV